MLGDWLQIHTSWQLILGVTRSGHVFRCRSAFLARGDKVWARFCCRKLLASPPWHQGTVWKTEVQVAKESTTLNSSHSSVAIRAQHKMLPGTPASIGHKYLSIAWAEDTQVHDIQLAIDPGFQWLHRRTLYALECRCGSSATAKILLHCQSMALL